MPRPVIAKSTKPAPAVPSLGRFRIGYVPLIDAAPLIVADALGFFARAGVQVSISRELGWGSIREKIVYGELDGAPTPGGDAAQNHSTTEPTPPGLNQGCEHAYTAPSVWPCHAGSDAGGCGTTALA